MVVVVVITTCSPPLKNTFSVKMPTEENKISSKLMNGLKGQLRTQVNAPHTCGKHETLNKEHTLKSTMKAASKATLSSGMHQWFHSRFQKFIALGLFAPLILTNFEVLDVQATTRV